ncbi:methylenetetrahydrofolate reductase C-terminal domain-containing protein [Desulfonatronospira sp.]|uniref:methylenetetrahydrofolate reductase C-terminal domain-containing protein n=1 Tax=Desulfonatronospira sp. TaxID=1962951 RepID=UPI0025B9BDE3|nr:methylenetetrahydrofolate reductase C-terminal domain-containing protein [Desulfonatronospira sp.]
MIVAEVKPMAEIQDTIKKYSKVLISGCGSCVTVCLSGGAQQVEVLASSLRTAAKSQGQQLEVGQETQLRQCDPMFIEQIRDKAAGYEAILSMGCGAGVQTMAETLGNIPVYPALDTVFFGGADGQGGFMETCAACGQCILSRTGGICPVARCAKSLTDGPCGGAQAGNCEVSKDTRCAWQLIYVRLVRLGQVHLLKETTPPKARRVHPARLNRAE